MVKSIGMNALEPEDPIPQDEICNRFFKLNKESMKTKENKSIN